MVKKHPIVLFDGVCNFCNGMVNFIIRQDHQKVFRFAALQSEAGQELVAKYHLPKSLESFILIEDGRVYKRSTAALRLYRRLPWIWRWIQLFWIVPRPARDAVYNLIARNRYRWFGKREECMVPTADVKSRFLG